MKVGLRNLFAKLELKKTKKVYSNFAPYLKPHWKTLLGAFVSMLVLILIELAKPWPLKIIFDYVLLDHPSPKSASLWQPLLQLDKTSLLLFSCAVIVILAVLSGVFGYFQNFLIAKVGQKVVSNIRLSLFSHIQNLPQSYHDTKETGDLLMRLTGDINMLRDMIVGSALILASRFFIILGMIVIMLLINWQLTLLALAVIPLLAVSVFRISGQIKQASSKQRRKESQITSTLHETITSISTVKAFAREKYMTKKFAEENRQSLKAGLKTTRLEATLNRLVEIITAVGIGLVLWFGTQKVLSGAVTPGDLLVFISYLRGVYRPLRETSNLTSRIAKATVCGERILEIFELKPSITDAADAIVAPRFQGKIEFRNVQFSYNGAVPVLKDINFVAHPGGKVALVGPSGAGKSTLIKLLLRLYDPQAGEILIDDADIKRFTLDSTRKKFGSVFQNALLFRSSLKENIAYARPKASLDEIIQAAQKARAHNFINSFPDGYETIIGEGGNTLSGGQRQRIAIARAILKDPPILLLDEPTAGLDAQTEKELSELLNSVMERKTCFIITHNLPLIAKADLILFLHEGRIVESGNHLQLLDQKGMYYHFYHLLESKFEKRYSYL